MNKYSAKILLLNKHFDIYQRKFGQDFFDLKQLWQGPGADLRLVK